MGVVVVLGWLGGCSEHNRRAKMGRFGAFYVYLRDVGTSVLSWVIVPTSWRSCED